ncbi:MAG: uroporphyrinogen-III synthase [Polyangiaceae bacterium]
MPLSGKRILVTRAKEQGSSTADVLRERGAVPVLFPAIEIHSPGDPAPLAACLRALLAGRYGWVVFTSANGVEKTWEALEAMGADARAFGRSRLAAIGPATAEALRVHGLEADVVASELRGEGLAEVLVTAASRAADEQPVALLARAEKAREVLPERLRAAGWEVDVVAAYENRPPSPEKTAWLLRELEDRRIDAVVFTSSSTVDNLCDLLGPRASERLQGVRIASIGPLTTATARERGLRVDVTAAQSTVRGLVQALEESW